MSKQLSTFKKTSVYFLSETTLVATNKYVGVYAHFYMKDNYHNTTHFILNCILAAQ